MASAASSIQYQRNKEISEQADSNELVFAKAALQACADRSGSSPTFLDLPHQHFAFCKQQPLVQWSLPQAYCLCLTHLNSTRQHQAHTASAPSSGVCRELLQLSEYVCCLFSSAVAKHVTDLFDRISGRTGTICGRSVVKNVAEVVLCNSI